MGTDATLKGMFQRLDAEREHMMAEKRAIAALVKPHILPERDRLKDTPLPEQFSSLGPQGLTNLRNGLLSNVFPPDSLWWEGDVSIQTQIELKRMGDNGTRLEAARMGMSEIGVASQMLLESANLQGRHRTRRTRGFRSVKSVVFDQILLIGDVLERLDDDYRLHRYSLNQYVTQRDDDGGVLYHCTWERIDPLSLDDEALSKIGMDLDEIMSKRPDERMVDLFSHIKWNTRSNKWTLEQEVGDVVFNEVDLGRISPYFSTVFELVPGDNYGISYVEDRVRGDLRSNDELTMRLLDHAGLAAKVHPCIGIGSQVRVEDIRRPAGTPITNVRLGPDGRPMDIGWFGYDKIANFQVVAEVHRELKSTIGERFLMGSEMVRDSERTTAKEVESVTIRELQGLLGDTYTAIQEDQQLPLAQRVIWQMRRDGYIPASVTEQVMDIRVMTGLQALTRENDLARIRAFVQDIMQIPGIENRLNTDMVISVMARLYGGSKWPGMVLTPEQREDEVRNALSAQLAGRAIEAAGTIAENQATSAA